MPPDRIGPRPLMVSTAADDETDYYELTGFQRDCLRTILALEADGPVSGQDIKHALEADQDRTINHGRLYPNLDELVDAGLVTKGTIDDRTNSYQTTDGGRELVRRAVQSWVDLLDADRQLIADGGPTVRYCSDCESVHPVDAACKPWGSTTDDNQR